MNIYRRYFHILDAKTRDEINRIWATRKAYIDGLLKIKDDIGAKDLHYYSRTGTIAGFSFKETPDPDTFKRVESGIYMPKKSTVKGKQIRAKIDALEKPTPIDDALKQVIPTHSFSLQDGMTFSFCTIFGRPDNLWFASVPWADVDPAELEQYKADKEQGKRGSSNFDHLLWAPPKEWIEVKEWEAKRAIDEGKKQVGAADDNAA